MKREPGENPGRSGHCKRGATSTRCVWHSMESRGNLEATVLHSRVLGCIKALQVCQMQLPSEEHIRKDEERRMGRRKERRFASQETCPCKNAKSLPRKGGKHVHLPRNVIMTGLWGNGIKVIVSTTAFTNRGAFWLIKQGSLPEPPPQPPGLAGRLQNNDGHG